MNAKSVVEALEVFIDALIVDHSSEHVEDALWLCKAREQLVEVLDQTYNSKGRQL